MFKPKGWRHPRTVAYRREAFGTKADIRSGEQIPQFPALSEIYLEGDYADRKINEKVNREPRIRGGRIIETTDKIRRLKIYRNGRKAKMLRQLIADAA